MGYVSGQARLSGKCQIDGGGGDASIVSLVPIAPDVSTDVQGGYDFTRTQQGALRYVDDLAMLDRWAPADAMTGERLLDVGAELTDDIELPAGEYIQYAPGAGIRGGPGLDRKTISGNVAGGLLRGPIWLRDVSLSNSGGTDAAVSSPGGHVVLFDNVLFEGPFGLTVSGVFGLVIFRGSGLFGGAGVTFSGVIGALQVISSAAQPTTDPTFIGWSFSASVFFGSAARFDGNAWFLADAGQSVIAIDTGVTSPAVACEITNSNKTDTGSYFKTGGSNIDQSDSRLIVTSSRDVIETRSAPDFIFDNVANPSVLSGAAADTWHVLPHIAGVGLGPGMHAALASQRWRAVDTLTNLDLTDATPLDRWALRAEGPTTVRQELTYRVTASASGNPIVRFRLEINTDPGVGGSFVPIPDSERPTTLPSQATPVVTGVVVIPLLTTGSRVRPTAFRAGSTLSLSSPNYTIIGDAPL